MYRNIQKKNHISVLLLLSLISFSFLYINSSSCSYTNEVKKPESYNFPYDLNDPHVIIKLPDYLTEISGLSYYKKNKIICVQDEKGKLIEYDLKKNKIIEKYDFGKDGDFEGIEIVNKKVFVLRSDGKIYMIKNFSKKDSKKKEYHTALSVKNDCEGLAYDSITNSLLIACKGRPSIGKEKKYEGKKAVYQFSLENKDLNYTPFILIDLEQIINLEKRSLYERLSYKLAKEIDDSGDVRFQPSGIAVHPKTHNIYVIASVGNRLIVFDRSGKILQIQKLDKKLFIQPEGICFKPNGDLFISNEGDGGKAKILKFKFRPE